MRRHLQSNDVSKRIDEPRYVPAAQRLGHEPTELLISRHASALLVAHMYSSVPSADIVSILASHQDSELFYGCKSEIFSD